MKKNIVLTIIFCLIYISGCTNETEKNVYQENIGERCEKHQDCKLPMDYAIRSNCPFGTACINDQCKVVCPLYYHDLNPEVSKGHSYTCQKNSDCDCTIRGEATLNCVCVDNRCLSVEYE